MITRLTQGLILFIPIVLFGWLLHQELIPSGVFVVERAAGERSPYVDGLQPSSRVSEVRVTPSSDTYQSILFEPVFFFAHPHRGFQTVETDIWFQNTSVPIMEFGALAAKDPDTFDLRPLHNLLIDQSNWDRTESDGRVLLQRTPEYDSIDAFLARPPQRQRVATYRASLEESFRLSDYQPTSNVKNTRVSLRGPHEFKTYLKEERLDFTFRYMDMNRDEGADSVHVLVLDEDDRPVVEVRALDDGNTSDNADGSRMRSIRVQEEGLSEGVYKIIFETSRDVFVREIQTPQRKLIVINRVFLGDEVGYRETPSSAEFYTRAEHMKAQTRHAESTQSLQFGSKTIEIDEPYAWVDTDRSEDDAGLVSVQVPKGDLEVVLDGHLAFTPDMYFQPDPTRLTHRTDLDAREIDFVYATYTSPERRGDWFVQTIEFDTSDLLLDDENWKFVISAPDVQTFDGEPPRIHNIRMRWIRPEFSWQDLKSLF